MIIVYQVILSINCNISMQLAFVSLVKENIKMALFIWFQQDEPVFQLPHQLITLLLDVDEVNDYDTCVNTALSPLICSHMNPRFFNFQPFKTIVFIAGIFDCVSSYVFGLVSYRILLSGDRLTPSWCIECWEWKWALVCMQSQRCLVHIQTP
jgi:hypothetical protein